MKQQSIRTLGAFDPSGVFFPHPRQLLGANYTDIEKEAIARYIETCPCVEMSGMNPLTKEPSLFDETIQLPLTFRSDGVWAYPESLAYYVRHGLALPAEFVFHVAEAGYTPPTNPLDYRTVYDDRGDYWYLWSLTHWKLNWTSFRFIASSVVVFPLRQLFRPIRRFVRPL